MRRQDVEIVFEDWRDVAAYVLLVTKTFFEQSDQHLMIKMCAKIVSEFGVLKNKFQVTSNFHLFRVALVLLHLLGSSRRFHWS